MATSGSIQITTIKTTYGDLHVKHVTPPSPTSTAVLFIHGNSFSSRIFVPLLTHPSLTSSSHLLVAFDLPGHGASNNMRVPCSRYTQRGYAGAAHLVLRYFNIEQAAVLGWSLGGHVALEMLDARSWPGAISSVESLKSSTGVSSVMSTMRHSKREINVDTVKGVMIVGTPAVYGEDDINEAFTLGGHWSKAFAAREDLSEEELETFARNCADPPYEAWMGEVVRRTEPCARKIMFEAFVAGGESNQRDTVARKDVLVAVVNGADEPFINLDYVRGLEYGNLWRGECFELEGLKHAPFWAKPETFGHMLREFVDDVFNDG